jgi:hypothetical protein
MKRYILTILVFFAGMALFAQSEELKLYTNLYDGTDTIAGQLAILKDAAASNIPDSGEFFAYTLNRLLLQYPNVTGANGLAAADDCARLIATALGDAQYTDAGPNLWKAQEAFSNSLVKADILMALAKGGMTNYLPHVVQLLNDLNTQIPSDQGSQVEKGRVAFGAILALEQFKDISGYLPVFFASTGWYDKRIKDQATASLPVIASDPTEPMLGVMKSPYVNEIKHLALRTEEASQASPESKSTVAVAALLEGWRVPANDVHTRNDMATMRKLAIDMIRRYGAPDEKEVYDLLKRSYSEAFDTQERLAVIAAFSALATDNAAQFLSSKIAEINQKQLSSAWSNIGLTRDDEQMIRALIPALGATKNKSARVRIDLLAVESNTQATNTVRNLAKAAKEEINR